MAKFLTNWFLGVFANAIGAVGGFFIGGALGVEGEAAIVAAAAGSLFGGPLTGSIARALFTATGESMSSDAEAGRKRNPLVTLLLFLLTFIILAAAIILAGAKFLGQ